MSGALQRLTGVTRVVEADQRDGSVGFEVESEQGTTSAGNWLAPS